MSGSNGLILAWRSVFSGSSLTRSYLNIQISLVLKIAVQNCSAMKIRFETSFASSSVVQLVNAETYRAREKGS